MAKEIWRCAKAPNSILFNLAKAQLAQCTVDGARAIMDTDPHHWSRAWFKIGSDCDSVDNNMCESFNKWIVQARYLPIISMLEAIRCKVMVRIQENRDKAAKWNTLICPNIYKRLKSYITESAFCHPIYNGDDSFSFEVKTQTSRFTVNLSTKTCSCRYWQLSGLPCAHAISCIYYKSPSLDSFIASCYNVDHFKSTYQHCLKPVEGIDAWPISQRRKPLAPRYVRMPGRPKKERKREITEKCKTTKTCKLGTIIRCSKCKGVGHNKSTCDSRQGVQSARNASGPPTKAIVCPLFIHCIVSP